MTATLSSPLPASSPSDVSSDEVALSLVDSALLEDVQFGVDVAAAEVSLRVVERGVV